MKIKLFFLSNQKFFFDISKVLFSPADIVTVDKKMGAEKTLIIHKKTLLKGDQNNGNFVFKQKQSHSTPTGSGHDHRSKPKYQFRGKQKIHHQKQGRQF